MRDQEKVAKPPYFAQTGWCWPKKVFDHTTPSAPTRTLRGIFLSVAATPPQLRRGVREPEGFSDAQNISTPYSSGDRKRTVCPSG
jgi:hypothetical protein